MAVRHSLGRSFAVAIGTMKHLRFVGLCAGAGLTAAAAFGARSPSNGLAVLSTNGTTGEHKGDDKVKNYIDAKAGALGFEVDFQGCDDAGSACASTLCATSWNLTTVSVDQNTAVR